jgi:glycosyltransferase involved in cell wall biosynthesis
MISVLILTKNEEANLPRCLESVAWSDDIVVLDDGSSDRTVDIARQHGARVICHSAGGERAQRTYSLREITFKYPWVYNPDADEVTPPELRDEMLRVVADADRPEVAYRVRFKNMFMGKWVKHSSLYPTWVVRLFRPDRVTFRREINLNYEIDGPEGRLQAHFEHYSFNKGLKEWFAKHNHYSDLEAYEAIKEIRQGSRDCRGLFCFEDPARRRKAFKNLAWRLPGRSFIVFFYLLIVRFGFLDGRAGITYCLLRGIYETMIDLKVLELRWREKGLGM